MLEVKSPRMEEINGFVNIKDIYEENKFDGCPEVLLMPESNEIEYNGLYFDGLLVGLLTLCQKNDGKEIHLSMLKGVRHLARKFVTHVLRDEPIVYACIPDFKISTINLAKRIGFKSMGNDGIFPLDGYEHPMELLCLQH